MKTLPDRAGRLFWVPAIACLLLAGLAGAGEVDRQSLSLRVGGAEVLELTYPVRRATIAAPDVADVVVLSPRELYVYGRKVGYTTVILWEEGNARRTLLDLVVSLDLSVLKEKLHQLFPKEPIEVYASDTGVVLSGTVSGPDVVDQVLRLTRTFMPQAGAPGDSAGGGTGTSGAGITNLLSVGGVQQVMLEVKFAEVTRGSGKDFQAALGIDGLGNVTGAVGTSAVLGTAEGAPSNFTSFEGSKLSGIFEDAPGLIQKTGSLLLNFAGNPANVFVNIKDFTAALQFLETEGMARTLAEPRLVTQSGREASFLAGGEFPIPVAQDLNRTTIEFKQFGVSLRFTPVVLGDGRINLRVAPTVSEIASSSTIPAGIVGAQFIVPNLATRQLETTVQLYDGQTLALAGLLQDNLREQIKKVPGLGDLPVIGALFRSTSFQRNKTDLLVAVTPHLVKANPEGTLRFPGDHVAVPGSYELYLEGRLEGERSAAQPPALSRHSFAIASATEQTGGAEALPAATPAPVSPGRRGGLEGDFGAERPAQ